MRECCRSGIRCRRMLALPLHMKMISITWQQPKNITWRGSITELHCTKYELCLSALGALLAELCVGVTCHAVYHGVVSLCMSGQNHDQPLQMLLQQRSAAVQNRTCHLLPCCVYLLLLVRHLWLSAALALVYGDQRIMRVTKQRQQADTSRTVGSQTCT